MNKKALKLSKDEREQQLKQLDGDWETITNRKTLTPKTKLKKGAQTTPMLEVPWPEVHAEMDLSDLTAARVSLAVTLTGLFEEQHIGFYKDADSACTALSVIIITLQSLAMSSEDQQNDSIWLSQFMLATTHMEFTGETLTCKMLDPPPNRQQYRRGGGSHWPGVRAGPYWKSIENNISGEIQEVQKLVIVGDMLITGFKGGRWDFVRGILETFGVFRSAKGMDVRDGGERNARRTYLPTKEGFLERIERRKGTQREPRMNESRAQAVVSTSPPRRVSSAHANHTSTLQQNYYAPLTGGGNLEVCHLPIGSRSLFEPPPLHTSSSTAPNSTGSNAVPLGGVTPNCLKRHRERENKLYRETNACEGNDGSTTDDDEAEKVDEKSKSSKRVKLNPDMRLLAEPEPGPSSQETPAMRRVRMEIEGVHICEEGVVSQLQEILGTIAGQACGKEQVL